MRCFFVYFLHQFSFLLFYFCSTNVWFPRFHDEFVIFAKVGKLFVGLMLRVTYCLLIPLFPRCITLRHGIILMILCILYETYNFSCRTHSKSLASVMLLLFCWFTLGRLRVLLQIDEGTQALSFNVYI